MDENSAEYIVDLFLANENILATMLKQVGYNDDTKKIFLPQLTGVILDSCSIVDAILRDNYNGIAKKRSKLNMDHYEEYFEKKFRFSKINTILLKYPLVYLAPFKEWNLGGNNTNLTWWKNYNDLKHDRLLHYNVATIDVALNSLCSIHQLFSKLEMFKRALLRKKLLYTAEFAIQYALDSAWNPSDNDKVTILLESELFATPIGYYQFPENIRDIRPFHYGNGDKLWRFFEDILL